MEFHIKMTGSIPDLGAIEHALRTADPSALVDIAPEGDALRVAASVEAAQVAVLVSRAGYPVAEDQVLQVPSICCGGCSG